MSSPNPSAGPPFAGIRVIEFGQFVAVPFCAQLLADGGADVIKIEAPEGDPTRRIDPLAPGETRTFLSRNRGKRSLPLNLRDPRAAPVVDALVASADVVLTNFRPGRERELGLDADTLCARHPRLIVGNVTAFGRAGDEAHLSGMDIVVQARSGLMAANGRIIDGRPAPGDPVSADYMCAMTLAFGVSAALLRRERTGAGGALDTSLMQAAMTLANNQLVRSEDIDAPRHKERLAQLADERARGVPYTEQAAASPAGRSMPLLMVYFRTYDTADAPIAIACGSHGLRETFMATLGIADPMLSSAEAAHAAEHYATLRDQVEHLLRSQPAQHWIDALRVAGVPVSSVRFPIELFEDKQAAANGLFHVMDHPSAGPVRMLAPPLHLDEDGFRPGPPTPPLGSQTRTLLADIGIPDESVEALVAAGVTHCGRD